MGHAVYAIFVLKQPRLQTDRTIVFSLAIKPCCCYSLSIVYPVISNHVVSEKLEQQSHPVAGAPGCRVDQEE